LLLFAFFTVLFYGWPYEAAQINENMGKNTDTKPSSAQIRAILCQSFRGWQRSLEIAKDTTFQRSSSQAG